MRIVINHLTRMQPGYICVAGLDPHTLQHIRPVLRGRLTRSLLRAEGGPFDIGALVDIGAATGGGVAPEVEDRAFTPWTTTYMSDYEPFSFWALLRESAKPHLAAIFGPELQRTINTCTLSAGTGQASLGCLVPSGRPSLLVNDHNTIRMRFSDGMFEVSAPVTDLRLYHTDQKTPRLEVITELSTRLARGVPVVLSVGVSREWTKPGDSAPRHWLQVNGIHLGDKPIWSHAEVERAYGRSTPTGGLDDIPF